MDFKDIVQKRRSIRKFTEEKLTEEQLHAILRAGLMAPTGHSQRGWKFIVVTDAAQLEQVSQCKSAGGEFLKGAAAAIVVAYDSSLTDVWIEDASIAAVTMQYQATELGLGSCWSQIRLRTDAEGVLASETLRKQFGLADNWQVECVLGFGYPAIERKLQDEASLKWESVVK